MIQQPGGTDLSAYPTRGTFVNSFLTICKEIDDYHKQFVYYRTIESEHALPDDKVASHRDLCLGLTVETVELLEAVDWKPWKINSKVDRVNICEEVIDHLFFLRAIARLWEISPEDMANMLERKLVENYRRLDIGYNTKATKDTDNE